MKTMRGANTCFGNRVKDGVKAFNLLTDITGMVSDKKPKIMGDIGTLNGSNNLMIAVFNHIVSQKIPPRYDPILNAMICKSLQDFFAVCMKSWIQNHSK